MRDQAADRLGATGTPVAPIGGDAIAAAARWAAEVNDLLAEIDQDDDEVYVVADRPDLKDLCRRFRAEITGREVGQ